jgi:hypothetical protein
MSPFEPHADTLTLPAIALCLEEHSSGNHHDRATFDVRMYVYVGNSYIHHMVKCRNKPLKHTRNKHCSVYRQLDAVNGPKQEGLAGQTVPCTPLFIYTHPNDAINAMLPCWRFRC